MCAFRRGTGTPGRWRIDRTVPELSIMIPCYNDEKALPEASIYPLTGDVCRKPLMRQIVERIPLHEG